MYIPRISNLSVSGFPRETANKLLISRRFPESPFSAALSSVDRRFFLRTRRFCPYPQARSVSEERFALDGPVTSNYLTFTRSFSYWVSSAVEGCAKAADSAAPSATRASSAILVLSNGLKRNREQIDAIPHSTAEM